MHELSIAQAIVNQAVDLLNKEGGKSIARVSLTIGVLSGIEEHSLRQVFTIACEDTPVQGAHLEIDVEQASVFCHDCNAAVVVTPPFMVCATCMGSNVDIKSGRDMIIKQMEIAT
jgi:hydrogenase nickel incorporation protein HypA/HybF